MTYFRAIEDFWCKEVESHYVRGMVYRVTRNHEYYGLINRWLDEGKIEMCEEGSSRLRGS